MDPLQQEASEHALTAPRWRRWLQPEGLGPRGSAAPHLELRGPGPRFPGTERRHWLRAPAAQAAPHCLRTPPCDGAGAPTATAQDVAASLRDRQADGRPTRPRPVPEPTGGLLRRPAAPPRPARRGPRASLQRPRPTLRAGPGAPGDGRGGRRCPSCAPGRRQPAGRTPGHRPRDGDAGVRQHLCSRFHNLRSTAGSAVLGIFLRGAESAALAQRRCRPVGRRPSAQLGEAGSADRGPRVRGRPRQERRPGTGAASTELTGVTAARPLPARAHEDTHPSLLRSRQSESKAQTLVERKRAAGDRPASVLFESSRTGPGAHTRDTRQPKGARRRPGDHVSG